MFAQSWARCSAAVAALLLIFVCGGCSGRRERPPAPPTVKRQAAPTPPRQAVEVRGSGISIRWRDLAGRPMLGIVAESLKGEEAGKRAILRHATARLYREGRLVGIVTAPIIEADGEKRVLVASGGVAVKSPDGQNSARADVVRWEADKQTIRGQGNVVVRWSGMELMGDEFIADTALGRVKIISKGNGKGRLR